MKICYRKLPVYMRCGLSCSHMAVIEHFSKLSLVHDITFPFRLSGTFNNTTLSTSGLQPAYTTTSVNTKSIIYEILFFTRVLFYHFTFLDLILWITLGKDSELFLKTPSVSYQSFIYSPTELFKKC